MFIKQVTNQVKFGGSSQQKREADEFQAKVGVVGAWSMRIVGVANGERVVCVVMSFNMLIFGQP